MVQKRFIISFLFFCCGIAVFAQEAGKTISIVDTLTAEQKTQRYPILLQSELDSLIRAHSFVKPDQVTALPPTNEGASLVLWLLGIIGILVAGIGVMMYFLNRNQRKSLQVSMMLHKQVKRLEGEILSKAGDGPLLNGKPGGVALGKKIQGLTRQLEQLTAEKEELVKSLTANTGVLHDFASIKQKMMDVYKIRNYPGFDKGKTETEIVKSLLDTERSVAIYAYEHFLKPVLSIADANKNNPARISKEDREKMLNLLISLSLLYSEYLYLRINDLSVGGKIIERIGNLQNGNKIDPALLKQLNREHGSRALVLRIALDKTSIQNLSYPVFDETNLNLS